jgi:hypothetical protein
MVDPSQGSRDEAQPPPARRGLRWNSVIVGLLIDALGALAGWALGLPYTSYGRALSFPSALYMLVASALSLVVGLILIFPLRTRRTGAGMLLGFGATFLLIAGLCTLG